ncbi:hypothetical protein HJC22_20450 [Corallococcus exiguus]|nr:hypothetical protein [Corallococcus exiguus]
MPRATEDLTSHDFVAYRGLKHLGALGLPEKHAHVLADDMLFLREAAKAGAGIALLPSFLALADVTSGQLVRVMPRYTLSTTSLTMLHPRAQHVPRKVSAFRDFLIDFLQARPLSAPPQSQLNRRRHRSIVSVRGSYRRMKPPAGSERVPKPPPTTT